MPPGKRSQSNAMLYTLVTFVGLLIIATAAGVIYYVKAEEYRTNTIDLQRKIGELATNDEYLRIGAIVGTKPTGKSWLGTVLDYVDQTVVIITGGTAEQTSAEVKVKNAQERLEGALELTRSYISIGDPNTAGLIPVIAKLKARLNEALGTTDNLQQQLRQLQQRFDDAMQANFEKEQLLQAEKEKLQQQVNEIKQRYNELEQLLEQSTDQQVRTLATQLEQERAGLKNLNQKLLSTEAELEMVQGKMKRTQTELQAHIPPPDPNVPAYKPDGEVILVDDMANVVHLNIGSDDKVYRGLTFGVYNRNASITAKGRGKAEVEVFDVAKTFSSARIISGSKKRPILRGDIIANLVWDKDRTNTFVVSGDFDLNGDGSIDYGAHDKIKSLIEKWGGRVADSVSADTDFLVLGVAPHITQKPTFEDLELDPDAMDKYNAAQERLAAYNKAQQQAHALWVPVLKYERFLYFIGYKGQVNRPGAF